MLYLLPENDTLQHICLEMRDYKDKTKEELLEIIRETGRTAGKPLLPTDPCRMKSQNASVRNMARKEILGGYP